MKNQSRIAGIYAMMAIALSQEAQYCPQETEAEKQARAIRDDTARMRSKGLSLFKYGENKLWALNQKSADKKAKKLGWIN